VTSGDASDVGGLNSWLLVVVFFVLFGSARRIFFLCFVLVGYISFLAGSDADEGGRGRSSERH